MKLQKFSGINNVLAVTELAPSEFASASNVDLDLEGRAQRRAGHTAASAVVHKNLWQARAYTLATRGAAGDLVNVDDDVVLAAGLGHSPRVWYCNLPDGRTLYSNGTSQGVIAADGASRTDWGVPIPASLGTASNAAGALYPGKYQWALTHVRLADGLEGGPAYSNAFVQVTTGGVAIADIPVPAGFRTNVYLASANGATRWLAGSTTDGSFSFTGSNEDLQLACRTEFMKPAPAGKLLAFWRGRTLAAVGKALFASRPNSWELFDLQRDFKHFSAPITLVQPVDGGVWVGTEQELCFLAGEQWDKLVRVVKMTGPVVLGSGCSVPGEQIMVGKGRGQGDAMVCIADGWLVAGMPDGSLAPLTLDRYRTQANEVAATFRMAGTAPQQYPQYIALPQ